MSQTEQREAASDDSASPENPNVVTPDRVLTPEEQARADRHLTILYWVTGILIAGPFVLLLIFWD